MRGVVKHYFKAVIDTVWPGEMYMKSKGTRVIECLSATGYLGHIGVLGCMSCAAPHAGMA